MNKLILLFFATILLSCQNEKEDAKASTDEHVIKILKTQFESSQMALGKIQPYQFENYIQSTGQTFVPNQYVSSLSTQLSGQVKFINFEVGDYVSKGQTIMVLESHELLDIEREYAQLINQSKFLKIEYERQKTLFSEKIASEKDFLKAESDYKTNLAVYKNLERKLEISQKSSSNIKNNNFSKSLAVVAPISGFITKIAVNMGSFVNPNDHLLDMIDLSKMQLKLKVFQDDLTKVKLGQTLIISQANNQDKIKAKITKISKIINPDDNSIDVFADFDALNNQTLVVNMYVNAKIFIGQEIKESLPNEGVLTEGKISYIFKLIDSNKNELTFRKMPIKTGLKNETHTEILSKISSKNNQFLTKGVSDYY